MIQAESIITKTPNDPIIRDYGRLCKSIIDALSDSNSLPAANEYDMLRIVFEEQFGEDYKLLMGCKCCNLSLAIRGVSIDGLCIIDNTPDPSTNPLNKAYYNGNYVTFASKQDYTLLHFLVMNFSELHPEKIDLRSLGDLFNKIRNTMNLFMTQNNALDYNACVNLSFFIAFGILQKNFEMSKEVFKGMQECCSKPFTAVTDKNTIYENLSKINGKTNYTFGEIMKAFYYGEDGREITGILQPKIV